MRCKQETGLVAVWSGVEERIQLDVIRSHPEDFEGFLSVKTAELAAASRVLAEFG